MRTIAYQKAVRFQNSSFRRLLMQYNILYNAIFKLTKKYLFSLVRINYL